MGGGASRKPVHPEPGRPRAAASKSDGKPGLSSDGHPEAGGRSSPSLREQYLERNAGERLRLDAMPESCSSLARIGLPSNSLLTSSKGVKYMHLSGLMDENDAELLRLCLFVSAGKPGLDAWKRRNTPGSPAAKPPPQLALPFDERDRSTWTLEALRELSTHDLGRMPPFAGETFKSILTMPLKLVKLTEENANNMWPLFSYLSPTDKFNLTHTTSGVVEFKLDGRAFESGTAANGRQQMQELRKMLFPEKQLSHTIIASPLHSITLPDAARARAGIPPEARFYSKSYPVLLSTTGPIDLGGESIWMSMPADEIVSATDAIRRSKTGITRADPFVCWLATGAFVYFNHTFDIVAINAMSFDETHRAPSALYMGEPSALPSTAIEPLFDSARWWPVTVPWVRELGFSHYSWVTPSEFIGDHIFTVSGGFAYLHKDDAVVKKDDSTGDLEMKFLTEASHMKSRYYPVVRNETVLNHPTRRKADPHNNSQTVPVTVEKAKLAALADDDVDEAIEIVRLLMDSYTGIAPLPYIAPLHIDQLSNADGASPSGPNAEKYLESTSAGQITYADGESSAHGLFAYLGFESESQLRAEVAKLCGVGGEVSDEELVYKENRRVDAALLEQLRSQNSWAVFIRDTETCDEFAAEVRWNCEYVMKEKAQERNVTSNDGSGSDAHRDTNHDGWTLERFAQEPPAVKALLTQAEVGALRLYTSSTFRLINGPLRCRIKPHPLAFTTLLISQALKKLRANNMAGKKFHTQYLWRGMKNRVVNEDFLLKGGAEMACMSTTSDLDIVASYARSHTPLLFRIKVDSPMELGANIQWLSMFPGEAEVLFPPLTYLKPMFQQEIRGGFGSVITLKPSFPT